jgi:hypothetical protein
MLKNLNENADSFVSVYVYHHGVDDDVDNDEGVALIDTIQLRTQYVVDEKTVISEFRHQVWKTKISRPIKDCIGNTMVFWKSLKNSFCSWMFEARICKQLCDAS